MIVGDTLKAPEERTKLLRLSVKDLQGFRRRAFHLKEDGGGLVVAEGEEELFTLPESATGIAAVPGKVFAHDPYYGFTYMMKEDYSGYEYRNSMAYPPFRIYRHYNNAGYLNYYSVTPTHVVHYLANSTQIVGRYKGGTCSAMFRERIFVGSGEYVVYSAAFNIENWKENRYAGGYLQLNTDEAGDILAMQPYKDKLFLFREHGITALRVLGDELNFKAVHLPMKCGRLVSGSVALCGEKVGYFTDGGLYLFNGATSVRAENARLDEIDLSAGVKSLTHLGRYYSLVTKKEGGKAVYCYDPEHEEAYFIENGAADIAAGDDFYFTRGTHAYRMTEKGVSEGVTPHLTAKNIAFGAGDERLLRTVAVEGEGTFSITVTSRHGTRTVRGRANEALKLRSPLRGNGFDIKISVDSADLNAARLCAVLFRFTEE